MNFIQKNNFVVDSVTQHIDDLVELAMRSIIDSAATAKWIAEGTDGCEVDYVRDARRESKNEMHVTTRSKGRRDGGGDLDSEAPQRLFWVLFRAQRSTRDSQGC